MGVAPLAQPFGTAEPKWECGDVKRVQTSRDLYRENSHLRFPSLPFRVTKAVEKGVNIGLSSSRLSRLPHRGGAGSPFEGAFFQGSRLCKVYANPMCKFPVTP